MIISNLIVNLLNFILIALILSSFISKKIIGYSIINEIFFKVMTIIFAIGFCKISKFLLNSFDILIASSSIMIFLATIFIILMDYIHINR